MTLDPKSIFIGVVDFFSVLLPGALVVLGGALGPDILRPGLQPLDRADAWLVFLFWSYVLGHLVFLIGARWLDELYDWVRKGTDHVQVGLGARAPRRPGARGVAVRGPAGEVRDERVLVVIGLEAQRPDGFREGKDVTGRWKAKASSARTKAEARRLAFELERKSERQRLGLEPLPTHDARGALRVVARRAVPREEQVQRAEPPHDARSRSGSWRSRG